LKVTDFDKKYLQEAGKLLQQSQKGALNSFGEKIILSHDQCCDIITNELEQNVSSSIMLFDSGVLIGFAIAVVKEDSTWGKSGWVNMGGWALNPDYNSEIFTIYKLIAWQWIKLKIYHHYFLVFASFNKQLEMFYELGFGKEQAHGIFDFSSVNVPENTNENSAFVIRKAVKEDQPQISRLSRVIADFQTKSPCFASAPDSYLQALDEGFSELTDDEEAEIYVIEKERNILGLEVFYKEEHSHLLIPPNSVELGVSAIENENRGLGAGFQLTVHAMNQQKKQGLEFSVTDWRCANPLSSRFWQQIGFAPVAYRLVRRVDPLI